MSTEKKTVKLPKNYDPKKDKTYMSKNMREYFRLKLVGWKAEIANETLNTVENLKSGSVSHPDPADTAAANADRQLELRARDRQRKLIGKIDKTLKSLENGEYGYCEQTGDEIGVGRLEARPIATLSIEAQEMHEKGEKTRAG